MESDTGVRSMAINVQDTSLLAKLEDLIATEGKYHLYCLVSLRNHHRSMMRNRACETSNNARNEAQAFVELLGFVEDSVESDISLFKFSVE